MPTSAKTRRAAATAPSALVLGALGVVFGHIGTSPISTVQTMFNPGDPHPVAVSDATIFGIVSPIFRSVTLIGTVTYVLLVMRADNHGEGGIMAPITRAWLALVFPACTLSYMGQGAPILDDPRNISSPFFLLVPDWGRWPLVILATAVPRHVAHHGRRRRVLRPAPRADGDHRLADRGLAVRPQARPR